MDAVTPGLTLGTLYSSGVGINKTKQHTHITMDCFEAPRMGLNLFFIKVSAAPDWGPLVFSLGPWKVEEP